MMGIAVKLAGKNMTHFGLRFITVDRSEKLIRDQLLFYACQIIPTFQVRETECSL